MRIHHVNCGTMCPVAGRLFYRNRERIPALDRLCCHCLIIETDRHGLVLVDTGFGRRDVETGGARLAGFFKTMNGVRFRHEETALSHVERLGYRGSDVRHILLTHLDFDHAGGIEDFPDAAVHLTAQEFHAAQNRRGFIGRRRYRPSQWGAAVKWRTYRADGEQWLGFAAVRGLEGLPPEILLVPLVGHSLGHAGIAIADGDGFLLHAGDAYFDAAEMDFQNPRCTMGKRLHQTLMEVDRTARLSNQQRLRMLRKTHGGSVRVICSHDPSELAAAEARPPTVQRTINVESIVGRARAAGGRF